MEEKMNILSPIYISGNANTRRFIGSFITSNIIAYACTSNILLWNIKEGRIYITLRGTNRSNINTLCVLTTNTQYHIFSGHADGVIIHWCAAKDVIEEEKPWNVVGEVPKSLGDGSGVDIVKGIVYNNTHIIIMVYYVEGALALYSTQYNTHELLCKLDFSDQLLEAISISLLPDSNTTLILAVGGYQKEIYIYTLDTENPLAQLQLSLSGHTNSIRDIDFITLGEVVYIASGSQDTYIRIWKLVELADVEEIITPGVINLPEGRSKRSYIFRTDPKHKYNITLESILSGHSDSVSSCKWIISTSHEISLLSTSFDLTLQIWKPPEIPGTPWVSHLILGEMKGSKNILYGGGISPDGLKIFAHLYNGVLDLWEYTDTNTNTNTNIISGDNINIPDHTLSWCKISAIYGHFGEVNDLSWYTNDLLFSCSKDFTTNIHAYLDKLDPPTWHVIARPQIHGYEINKIALTPSWSDINNNIKISPPKLISGGDEKILRIYTPPYMFIKILSNLSNQEFKYSKDKTNLEIEEDPNINNQVGQGPLALTNININTPDNPTTFNPKEYLGGNINNINNIYNIYNIYKTPDSEYLSEHSLWPEDRKLYGHQQEIASVCISRDGHWGITTSQSLTEKDAQIYIWDIYKGRVEDKLEGHKSTVNRVRFHPIKYYIFVSVGEDRQIILWGGKGEGQDTKDTKDTTIYINSPYTKLVVKEGAHPRGIEDCTWSPNGKLLLTISRGKLQTIKIWDLDSHMHILTEIHNTVLNEEIPTSCAFFPFNTNPVLNEIPECESYKVVIGSSLGAIYIYTIRTPNNKGIQMLCEGGPEPHALHSGRVNCLTVAHVEGGVHYIATGGSDNTVRVFRYIA